MSELNPQAAYTAQFYETLRIVGVAAVEATQTASHEDQVLCRKEAAEYLLSCDTNALRRCTEQVITLYALSTNPMYKLSLRGVDIFGSAVLDATDDRREEPDVRDVRHSLMRARQIVQAQRSSGRSPINQLLDFRRTD